MRLVPDTPVLVDLKPNGQFYMDDLHRAGGMAPILRALKPLLHLDCLTVTGRTLGEEIDSMPAAFPQMVVRSLDESDSCWWWHCLFARQSGRAMGQLSNNRPVHLIY
jgi:dihydroxyacid dehydratase/phosphogluconate dehydratase